MVAESATIAQRRQLRDLLLAVARRDCDANRIASLVRGVDATELVQFAQQHRMVSLLHLYLGQVDGVPGGSLDALAKARYVAQARRIVLLRMLARATEALDVPALTMKGHALAANWYANPDTRDFNDLDVLVRPRDFERALAALALAGMTPATTNWHGFLAHEVAEVPVQLRSAVLDLHWHVVALGQERRHLLLPTLEFFDRAVPARFGDVEMLTLGPVDTLLHLCVNTGLGGARHLRGLIDIDTVVRSGRVDMAAFAIRVRETGAGRLCAAMLQRVSYVMATPVDPELLFELTADRSWLMANRLVDRSGQRRQSGNVASGLLLSSGRNTRRATAIALWGGTGRAVATRMGRRDLTDAGGALDWTRQPDDGDVPGHRRKYLGWVGAVETGSPSSRVNSRYRSGSREPGP